MSGPGREILATWEQIVLCLGLTAVSVANLGGGHREYVPPPRPLVTVHTGAGVYVPPSPCYCHSLDPPLGLYEEKKSICTQALGHGLMDHDL